MPRGCGTMGPWRPISKMNLFRYWFMGQRWRRRSLMDWQSLEYSTENRPAGTYPSSPLLVTSDGREIL